MDMEGSPRNLALWFPSTLSTLPHATHAPRPAITLGLLAHAHGRGPTPDGLRDQAENPRNGPKNQQVPVRSGHTS